MAGAVEETLWIEIAPPEGRAERMNTRLDRVEAGLDEARITYSFPSLEQFLATLTPNRWALILALLGEEPMSLRALARKVGRDVRGVHTDVHRLLGSGLIEKTSGGQLRLFGNQEAEPECAIPACRITRVHVDFTVDGGEQPRAA